MSLSIEHITCPSGDYEIVLINGSVDYEGNSIPTFYWIDLLESFGFYSKKYRSIRQTNDRRKIFQ